jgi:hypothetical protein
MWAKTSSLLAVGLLLAGCGSSAHQATSSDPPPTTFTTKEISAFNEACASLGLGGSLGDAPVCECALDEVEAQTNPSSFALDVVAWKDNSESGSGNENIPKEAVSKCVTKQQSGEVPEPGSESSQETSQE